MSYTIDVHLSAEEVRRQMQADAVRGLQAEQKSIPPVWFYDERGSKLFEEITQLPEYYPTRAERALLEEHSPAIAELARADTLVELGAGACEKTRVLLSALRDAGTLSRYVPFDVSDEFLRSAAAVLAQEYDNLDMHLVIGDFHQHLPEIPVDGRRMVAFLGGTIGNLDPRQRARFLFDLNCTMSSADWLLLGTDLVKDQDRLVAAYDDAAGVTPTSTATCSRCSTHSSGATSTSTSSGTSRSGTNKSSGSRCACGPKRRPRSPSAMPASRSSSRKARTCSRRSARNSRLIRSSASSARRASSWRVCGEPRKANSC